MLHVTTVLLPEQLRDMTSFFKTSNTQFQLHLQSEVLFLAPVEPARTFGGNLPFSIHSATTRLGL